jgi:hypothetical protein
MQGDTFTIVVRPYFSKQSFRMQVEIYYASENVIRFRITAGKKIMEMDKQIYRKSNQWKLTRYETNSTQDPRHIADAIVHIQGAIDSYLKKNYPSTSGR